MKSLKEVAKIYNAIKKAHTAMIEATLPVEFAKDYDEACEAYEGFIKAHRKFKKVCGKYTVPYKAATAHMDNDLEFAVWYQGVIGNEHND